MECAKYNRLVLVFCLFCGLMHGSEKFQPEFKPIEAERGNTMAKNNNANATVNEILKNEADQSQPTKTVSPYATNAMRPAIIARSLDGKKRAITPQMASEAGVSKETLDQWKYNVECLYKAALEYHEAIGTDSEAQAEQVVWDCWRNILKAGEKVVLSPNMFVRQKDIENIRVYATALTEEHVHGVGFVATYTGLDKFRGKIETRLALRIAGNAILKDDDREVIQEFQKANRRVIAAGNILNGYVDGKTEVPSIGAKIADAEQALEDLTATLKAAKIRNIEKYTGRQKALITNLKREKKAAEDRLKKWSEVVEKLADKYEELINTLDSIEDAQEVELPKQTAAEISETVKAAAEKVLNK